MSFSILSHKFGLFINSFKLIQIGVLCALFASQNVIAVQDVPFKDSSNTTEIIESTIPDGVEIRKTSYGYGVFASRSFKDGEIIYKNQFIEIEDRNQYFLLKIGQQEFLLDSVTHSVAIGEGKRALYTFDSMMNHSCDANSYSKTPKELIQENAFLQIACRNIEAGEEITCNYLLFEYDCSDKAISNCLCQSDQCLHEIRGFKWLSAQKQQELLPQVDDRLLEQYLLEHPDIIYIKNLETPTTKH